MPIADVSTPSLSYNEMARDWPLIDAVISGTKAVRRAGKSLLPQHQYESEKNYENRLAVSVFSPFFKLTLLFFQGRVFSKPIKTSDKLPDQVKEWMTDIDLTGRDLNALAQEVLFNGLGYGMDWLLVDNFQNDGEIVTQEDAKKAGLRPYIIRVPAKNVLYARASADGKTIEEARIRETSKKMNGYEEVSVEKVRVFKPFEFELWAKSVKGEWVLETSGKRGLKEVPLFPFYTNKTGAFQAECPILDLAYLNIAHYQSRSNLQNTITVAQFPILAATGYTPDRESKDDGGGLVIGPRKALISQQPETKFYYVEHSGAAIGSGRQYLEDLKGEMAIQGISLLMPKGQNSAETTATEEKARQEDTQTQLAVIADNLCDTFDMALYYMAVMGGIDSTKEAETSLEGSFSMTSKDAADIANLLSMRQSGEITRQTFYAELKRRGFLSESFDGEKEEEMLSLESPDLPDEELPLVEKKKSDESDVEE